MRDLLEKCGFIKTNECKCAGTLMESWQHPNLLGLLVEIKPNRGSFEIWNMKKYYRGNRKEFDKVITELLMSVASPDPTNPRRFTFPSSSRKCCGKRKGLR